MNNDFVWTDKLVKEFFMLSNGFDLSINKSIEQFKQSHSKKEWEIVSFWCNDKLFELEKSNYRHGDDRRYVLRHDEYATTVTNFTGKEIIHSVRRLSDWEVFTVGDKVKYKGEKCGYDFFIIDNFFVKDNDKLLARSKNSIIEYLHEIVKVKQPLFITQDDKPIYEGDDYWYVGNWIVNKHCKLISTIGISSDLKYFSTEQAAKEYVLHNKPVLSVDDILGNCADKIGSVRFADYVLQLAKEKLNK